MPLTPPWAGRFGLWEDAVGGKAGEVSKRTTACLTRGRLLTGLNSFDEGDVFETANSGET